MNTLTLDLEGYALYSKACIGYVWVQTMKSKSKQSRTIPVVRRFK